MLVLNTFPFCNLNMQTASLCCLCVPLHYPGTCEAFFKTGCNLQTDLDECVDERVVYQIPFSCKILEKV